MGFEIDLPHKEVVRPADPECGSALLRAIESILSALDYFHSPPFEPASSPFGLSLLGKIVIKLETAAETGS